MLFPGMVFLGIFVMIPILYGLGISLYDYNPANSRNPFLGLANYRRLIRDEVFWKAVGNTVFFCVAAVSANIVVTLFLAKLISVLPSKGLKTVFRTIFFIPCIAPMVGTAMIWKYGIIGTENGVVNQIVQFFGGTPKNWFMTGLPLMMFIIFTRSGGYRVQHRPVSAGIEGCSQGV